MEKPTYILGLSFDYHDSAAVLVKDGVVVAAVQEERLTRKKHDSRLPESAIAFCLDTAGITPAEITAVAYYERPLLKFERLLRTYIATWPWGLLSFAKAMLTFFSTKLWVEHRIHNALDGFEGEVLFVDHHEAHAASTFYTSGAADAVIVTMDGVGEWETTSIGVGHGADMEVTHAIHFPHSLGLLYSALTFFLGFKVNSAEYKVMGLAPYGDPDRFYDQMKSLVTQYPDGSFALDMSYFAYQYGLKMTTSKMERLFGVARRTPESPLEQEHKDIAAALQQVTEELILGVVGHAKEVHPERVLCLAGGVALNCVANGTVARTGWFDRVSVHPAAGDAGGALGAALYCTHHVLGLPRPEVLTATPHTYLGPSYADEEIERVFADQEGEVVYQKFEGDAMVQATVAHLGDDAVVGWFQGALEWGPRALGNRSILADPRNKENWQRVNRKIKFRESFRPFAPSVLAEQADEIFELSQPSPHMLFVAPVRVDTIPAVTHVDGSARIQTVSPADNERYHALLKTWYEVSGCPVLINTSFNIRGEPIVCSPQDALHCFLHTDMDVLVVGNYVLQKKDNMHLVDAEQQQRYMASFDLD